MIGILVCDRNLNPTWSDSRYPKLNYIRPMLERLNKEPNCFSTLHLDQKRVDDWSQTLVKLTVRIGELPKGFQINVMHPQFPHLRAYKGMIKRTDIKTILKYSTDFMKYDNYFMDHEVEDFMEYTDYFLIDPSRGAGIEIDIKKALFHYKGMKELSKDISVGFAGGLNHKNIEKIIKPIIKEVGLDFSLDIESGVRDDDDKFSPYLFETYIMNLMIELKKKKDDDFIFEVMKSLGDIDESEIQKEYEVDKKI